MVVFAYAGVIGRSVYWLVYWLPHHSNLEKNVFESHLPEAVGSSVVEVGVA